MAVKIHIIGGAGSGKSYLASQIHKKMTIPHLDLDDIFWENQATQYGIKANEDTRDYMLEKFLNQPSWVVEGVYLKWVTPSFERADRIFILDTPLQVQEDRIWNRYYKRKSKVSHLAKKETLQSIHNLLEWNKKYNEIFLPEFMKKTAYTYKIILLKDYKDIERYL